MNEKENVAAFLDLIACHLCEGTASVKGGADGYNVLFGGHLFSSYETHPRIKIKFGNDKFSTAAGRYQINAPTFDDLRKRFSFSNFTPATQDKMAIRLIMDRGALQDVQEGRITSAIAKCAGTWASFPGNSYGQPNAKLPDMLEAFKSFGGIIVS